jgi:hypothetical protein
MPGSSVWVERIISLMNYAWSDERARMNENTVWGLMVCKMNFGLTCNEFYEKIKNNIALLKKVHLAEKYQY